MGLSLAFAMLDLILPAPDRHQGRLTLILIAVNTLLYQSQYLTGRQIYDLWAVMAAGPSLPSMGSFIIGSLKTEWAEFTVIPDYWSGLLIIVGITVVKLVELQTWPPFLNEYSANTGVWGMESVGGTWPEFPFQGRGFDLRGGGASPLMLPVMWVDHEVVRCQRLLGPACRSDWIDASSAGFLGLRPPERTGNLVTDRLDRFRNVPVASGSKPDGNLFQH